MRDESVARCLSIIARCRVGAISPEIAVMEMLIASEDEVVVERAISDALAQHAPDEPPDKVIARLAGIVAANREGCAKIARLLREEALPGPAMSTDESLRFYQELFDRLAASSEEASVALYSLGNPEILAQATDELVTWLDGKRLLMPTARVLDFGCGIGRIAASIASRVAHVTAVDLSGAMVAHARARCAKLANVRVDGCDGRALPTVESGAAQLVLAVDSFPYVVLAGRELVDLTMAELSRVLTAGGHLAIFNFAYDQPLPYQRERVEELAKLHGFAVVIPGMQPFALWNGTVFLLRRDGTRGAAGRRPPKHDAPLDRPPRART